MDKKDMREKNQEIILSALKRLKESSKPNLAKETGISVVTVTTHLDALIKKGEVELIEEEVRSIGGRPARLYRLNASRHLTLGAYITPENFSFKLTTFVINLFGEVISGTEATAERVTLDFLENEIKSTLSNFPNISYVVLGLDGEELSGVFTSDTYGELNGIELREELSSKTNCPVTLARDVDAAIIGAAKLEGLTLENNAVVGVSWKENASSTGILINGKPYLGRDGYAGNMNGLINTNNAVEDAARALSLIIRLVNPNEIILYNQKLRVNDEENIKGIVLREIDEKFLPKILIRPDIREDYGEGIYTLAASFLNNNEVE